MPAPLAMSGLQYLHGFTALPPAGPECSDAASCLFLHPLAIRTMHLPSSWPEPAATRPRIRATEATEMSEMSASANAEAGSAATDSGTGSSAEPG